MAPPTVYDILAFHQIERAVYEMVVLLGANRSTARCVLAMWMWLEFLIGADFIPKLLNSNDGSLIHRLMVEAVAILACLREGAPLPADGDTTIALTNSLVSNKLSLRWFYYNRNIAVKAIAGFMDRVGKLIFDNDLNELFRVHLEAVEEAHHHRSRGVLVPLPELPLELAKPYNRDPLPTPEDGRSMFITFSRGSPITPQEISNYFTKKWGHCLDQVKIELTEPGVLPMYGRMIFVSESYIDLAFNEELSFSFVINGRNMCARKYAARRNKKSASESGDKSY